MKNIVNSSELLEESKQEVMGAFPDENRPESEEETTNVMNSNQMAGGQSDQTTEIEKTTPTYEWKDITKEFFVAIKDLSLGELMHHELFGLFEAMSAIEMMDPKMDAGMCCKKEKPLRFHTAVSVSFREFRERLHQKYLIGFLCRMGS